MSAEAAPGVEPVQEAGAMAAGRQQAAVLAEMAEEAAVWCAVHGLVVGDRADPRSGTVPGVGLVHAPISLLPARFPASFWEQACELAPIFNELVDRVSLDGEFLQAALSRTKQVDKFTARLLEIHEKMMAENKKEDIRLGLHRSDYMLDSETNSLLQIELNTISSSFPGLGSLVSELHRTLLNQYGKVLGLDSKRIPRNWAATQFAEALGKTWAEYNNDSAIVLMVVQPEERNMYDQYWLVNHLKESYGVTTARKTLAQVEAEGQVLTDGTLLIDSRAVAVVYFRAGYAPTDYPSEAVGEARAGGDQPLDGAFLAGDMRQVQGGERRQQDGGGGRQGPMRRVRNAAQEKRLLGVTYSFILGGGGSSLSSSSSGRGLLGDAGSSSLAGGVADDAGSSSSPPSLSDASYSHG